MLMIRVVNSHKDGVDDASSAAARNGAATVALPLFSTERADAASVRWTSVARTDVSDKGGIAAA